MSTKRDFIHINDLIQIIENIVHDKSKYLTLNCGYGKSISILEIVKEFEKKYAIKLKKKFKIKETGDPFEVIADTHMLNKLFNFKPQHNSAKKVLNEIKNNF